MTDSLNKEDRTSGPKEHVEYFDESNYLFHILRPEDEELITDTADCLAESFVGTEIEGVLISEPLVVAYGLSKEAFFEFVKSFIKNKVTDGLCVAATDKGTGRVVAASISEVFDPDEETPIFEGPLTAMNEVMKLLDVIDKAFVDVVERKTCRKINKNEYVRSFMGGGRTKISKRYILSKVFELKAKAATEKGYKGIFGEATNPKSLKVLTQYCGCHPVYDESGNYIAVKYKDFEMLNAVPEQISKECVLFYRPLHPEFDL